MSNRIGVKFLFSQRENNIMVQIIERVPDTCHNCVLLRFSFLRLPRLWYHSCEESRKQGFGWVCVGFGWVLVGFVWVLAHLVISCTRQGVRFVTGIGFCILWYHARDRGYDLLRALGSASCDNKHETGGTICYGHWVLHLVISQLRGIAQTGFK